MSQKFEGPKGTRDFVPGSMNVREKIIRKIEEIFGLYGFQKWDGPAFEYLDLLTAKSSPEIVKEIYAFEDKAGRKLGLRFELTTSLARLMANIGNVKKPIKAYNIGKVWRYENTQKGRYREFLQMDADVFGADAPGMEVELLRIATRVLAAIGFEKYRILINNRKILNGLTSVSGIPAEKKQDAFRALDKLAKIGKEGVRKEFEQRGLTADQFEKLMAILGEAKSLETLKNIMKDDADGLAGTTELENIISMAGVAGIGNIQFDPTLIRGFDYYTGPIYEIRIIDGEDMGSISGGGRYDRLVETFGGQPTTAVGISFGIERIIDLIETNEALKSRFASAPAQLFICHMNPELLSHAFTLAEELRNAGISVDMDMSSRKFQKQMQYADDKKYPTCLIIGEDEAKSGEYMLKDMKTGEQRKMGKSSIIALLVKE